MSEWDVITLGEISDIKGGKRLPKGSQLSNVPSSHPYIRTTDIKNNSIIVDELLFVTNEIFPSIKRYTVNENDVIISIVGTIGSCAIVPKMLHLASLTENCAKIVNIEESKLDRIFLFYYLISDDGQAEIESRNVGSTQPKLPLYNIAGIPLLLPPLSEQKAIASVLSSLDYKIDILHRQNKTLEAIAETIFRQWFVEEAQEDWEPGTLGDIIDLVYGKGLKEENRTGSEFPVVGSSGIVGYHSEFLAEGPGVVIGRKGTLGVVTYIFENFFPIDTTYYIRPKNHSHGLFYEYSLLKTLSFENSDSAVPGLNRDIALSEELTLPPQSKIDKFNQCCIPLFKKIKNNLSQIRTLEKLRDTLLPKLMSGEVRVAV